MTRAIYRTSADPALSEADADDDVDLFGTGDEAATPYGTAGIGVAFLRVRGRIGEVVFIGIHPDHRGVGEGRRLLSGSCAALSHQGAREVRLAVSAVNEPALRLYRAFGFVEVGRARLYRRWLPIPTGGAPSQPPEPEVQG